MGEVERKDVELVAEQVKCPKCGKMGTLKHRLQGKNVPEHWYIEHSITYRFGLLTSEGCFFRQQPVITKG